MAGVVAADVDAGVDADGVGVDGDYSPASVVAAVAAKAHSSVAALHQHCRCCRCLSCCQSHS